MADLYVAEVRHEGAPRQAGSHAALFPYDQEAWSDEKLERTLRWLSYSRTDLLAAIEGMSDEEIRAHRVQPDRTLHDTLWHVANAEYGYIFRVTPPLGGIEVIEDDYPADVRERMAAIREVLVRSARALSPHDRNTIVYPWWASRPDEPWTLVKALRRALEHEREHLLEIYKKQ
jgi:uncharacterized damage-inducible protein DinB